MFSYIWRTRFVGHSISAALQYFFLIMLFCHTFYPHLKVAALQKNCTQSAKSNVLQTFPVREPTFCLQQQVTHISQLKAHKIKEDLSNDRVVMSGVGHKKVGESMAACGFSYMGQRGARGQSLRASWQWQHQCQTLEEERTCMMVSPKE